MRVGSCRQHSGGLVHGEIDSPGAQDNWYAIDFDLVALGVGLCAQLTQNRAVYSHARIRDEGLYRTARTIPCASEDLLESFPHERWRRCCTRTGAVRQESAKESATIAVPAIPHGSQPRELARLPVNVSSGCDG